MTVKYFLLARIADDERAARDLLKDLDDQIAEEKLGADERGPFTPTRMLSAQLWAHYDGQTRRRNFARGQQIAKLADPARVLRECEAKRRIIRWVGRSKTRSVEGLLEEMATAYSDHPDYGVEWPAGGGTA